MRVEADLQLLNEFISSPEHAALHHLLNVPPPLWLPPTKTQTKCHCISPENELAFAGTLTTTQKQRSFCAYSPHQSLGMLFEEQAKTRDRNKRITSHLWLAGL